MLEVWLPDDNPALDTLRFNPKGTDTMWGTLRRRVANVDNAGSWN